MRDVLDVLTSFAGAFLLTALAVAVLKGGYEFSDWQMPVAIGVIALVAALPFERVKRLSRLARDLLPFG